MQDAHQPFHATNNFDGQLTNNTGVHARFERDLVERFLRRMTVHPARPSAIRNARDTAFDVLLASYELVDGILQADADAIAGGTRTTMRTSKRFSRRCAQCSSGGSPRRSPRRPA
jgi:hypothetical protein